MKHILLTVGIVVVFTAAGVFLFRHHAVSAPTYGSHFSMYYFDNPGFFTNSLAPFASTTAPQPTPRLFIVNQHILAASLIAHQFVLAADPSVTTVVLMTQNNWNAGTAPIIVSQEGWKTPLGDIAPDSALITTLIRKGAGVVDESIYPREHGITGIVPYVAWAFPHARIVTLVIRDKTPNETLDALANVLGTVDLSHTAIVASIDMSHYLPAYIADAHDRKTLEAIRSFDISELPRLDIDTAPTLRVLMQVAKQVHETTFLNTGHANSATITHDPELLSTTSYLTGYFATATSSQTTQGSSPLDVLFVGDVMLDRTVAEHAQRYGGDSLVAGLERLFLGTDAVVGNLEGTITNNASVSIPDHATLRFTFDPHFAGFLADHEFSAVSLANNHALDFGESGYQETLQHLASAGIQPFGSPRNDEHLSTILTLHDQTLCLVGYHMLYNPNPSTVLAEIVRLRPSCTFLIVMAHWGVEYQPIETPEQKDKAHAFIDAGADVVVGAHPHVVEPLEIYHGKPIFYSLGNFLFDQDFSFATEHGLAVHMELAEHQMQFTLVPVTLKDATVSISPPSERTRTLDALVDSQLDQSIRNSILTSDSFTLSR